MGTGFEVNAQAVPSEFRGETHAWAGALSRSTGRSKAWLLMWETRGAHREALRTNSMAVREGVDDNYRG